MNRDRVYLQDILTAAASAREYLQDVSRERFGALREKQSAVIRELELVGEAARRVSGECREALTDIPWRRLTGMRNFLIHQYDNIDLDTVFDTVMEFLPPLIERLRQVVDALDQGRDP